MKTIAIIALVISGLTLLYAIWIDYKRRKLENILLEPHLSFGRIVQNKEVVIKQNHQNYKITNHTNERTNTINFSIKNDSGGLAKNVRITKCLIPNYLLKNTNDSILDISVPEEKIIILEYPENHTDNHFKFEVKYFTINGEEKRKEIEFFKKEPVNRNGYDR